MRRSEYDPSAQHGPDIQLLASKLEQQPGGNPEVTTGDDRPSSTASPAAGGPITAGAVTFAPPPGWAVVKSSAGAATLEHHEKDKRSLIIVGSDPLAGSLVAALRQSLTTAFRDFDLKLGRIEEARTTHGHAAAFFDEEARHRTKRLRLRFAGVAVDLNGRMQIAWLMTPEGAASYDRKRELETLVKSWSYAGGPAKPAWDPLNPPRGSGGLSGLYWGTTLELRINPLGGMDTVAERKHLLLLPNGWAYNDVPPGGKVMDIDFAGELRRAPKRCGLYSVQGKQLVFDWITDYGLIERTTVPFERRGANEISFSYNGTSMSIVRPVQNLRLSGKYTSLFHMSGNLGGSSNSITSERSIEFAPDGRYRKSGFAAFSFSHETGGDRTSSGAGYNPRAPNGGRYVINGYKLTLTPDQGPEEVFTLIIESLEPEVKALFIDDSAFLK